MATQPFNTRNFTWSVGCIKQCDRRTLSLIAALAPTSGFIYNRLQDPLVRWNGYLFEVSQQQYLALSGDDLSYGRTYLHAADLLRLGYGNKIYFQARAAFAPNLPFSDVVDLGDAQRGRQLCGQPGQFPVFAARLSLRNLRGPQDPQRQS